MSTKDKWIAERAERLQKGSVQFLVGCAEDAAVPISDLDSIKAIAQRIAEAERGARHADAKDKPYLRRNLDAPWPGYPLADEFNAMECPAEETFYHRLRLDQPPATESAHDILSSVLPQVLGHFFKKNADYGDNHRDGLGARAEYVGIHRKVKKLEKALWLGETMNGESAEEMLTDLIGQCLITLDLLQEDST